MKLTPTQQSLLEFIPYDRWENWCAVADREKEVTGNSHSLSIKSFECLERAGKIEARRNGGSYIVLVRRIKDA